MHVPAFIDCGQKIKCHDFSCSIVELVANQKRPRQQVYHQHSVLACCCDLFHVQYIWIKNPPFWEYIFLLRSQITRLLLLCVLLIQELSFQELLLLYVLQLNVFPLIVLLYIIMFIVLHICVLLLFVLMLISFHFLVRFKSSSFFYCSMSCSSLFSFSSVSLSSMSSTSTAYFLMSTFSLSLFPFLSLSFSWSPCFPLSFLVHFSYSLFPSHFNSSLFFSGHVIVIFTSQFGDEIVDLHCQA